MVRCENLYIRGWIEFTVGYRRKSIPGQSFKMPKSEIDVVRECKGVLELLRCHRLLEFRSIHVVYGTKPSDRIKSVQMAGLPDLQIYLAGGITLNIEFKSEIGKQRPAQKEWQGHLEKLGHHYFLCRSVEDLATILLKHGIDKTKYTWQNFPKN